MPDDLICERGSYRQEKVKEFYGVQRKNLLSSGFGEF